MIKMEESFIERKYLINLVDIKEALKLKGDIENCELINTETIEAITRECTTFNGIHEN